MDAAKRSRSSARLLPPPELPAFGSRAAAPAASGLAHSATVTELRTAPRMADDSEPRPGSAPGESSGSGGGPGSSAGAPSAAPELSLTEQMERHLLENQRLRESLLYFTSKKGGKKGKKGARDNASLGMPLPPV